MMEPNSLVDKNLISIPYKLGKCGFDGADCIGAVILWYRSQGIEFQYNDGKGPIDMNWYEKSPRRFLDAAQSLGDIIKFSELKKYDLIMMIGNEMVNYPSCLAVMVDDRHLFTSMEDRGSFVEMLNMYWKSKYYGAIRPHKVKHLQGE